jgi:transposase
VVTEHTIHRDWCPRCKKSVEPRVPDAVTVHTSGRQFLKIGRNQPRRHGKHGEEYIPEYARKEGKWPDATLQSATGGSSSRRLLKRFRRHRDDLLTSLDDPAVPFDNNAAERAIRPAVIIRKNSYGNRSQRGADTQAVLMSINRTLKQRGYDPLTTITDALAKYPTTGKLPGLPPKFAPNG